MSSIDLLGYFGMELELVFAAVLLCRRVEHRGDFYPRLVASVASYFAFGALWGLIPLQSNAWSESLFYALLCLLGAVGLLVCLDIRGRQALFYMTTVCVMQHLSYKCFDLAATILATGMGLEWMYWIVYPVGVVALDLVLARACSERMQTANTARLSRTSTMLLMAGMLLFTSLFQNLFRAYGDGTPMQLRAMFEMFDILCSLFILGLMLELCRRGGLEADNNTLRHVLAQQRQQMETSKEAMEAINIKCHDLKHQLEGLGPRVSEEEIAELNEALDLYASQVKTGNEAADVLLAERSLVCEREGIQLQVMADGEALGALRPADVYALLGNMVDNAIEAVRKVDEGKGRYIDLKIQTTMGMLSISCENPYEGELAFADGLPATTKAERSEHGFGLKSMRLICEKYGGYLSVKTDGGLFAVSILIPLA